jgi:hypothetical protein
MSDIAKYYYNGQQDDFYDSYGYHKSRDSLLLCMRDAGGRISGLNVNTFILSVNS